MSLTTPNSSVRTPIAYYVIEDGGDGSAYATFFKNYEDAETFDEGLLEKYGQGSLSEGVRSLFADDIKDKLEADE